MIWGHWEVGSGQVRGVLLAANEQRSESQEQERYIANFYTQQKEARVLSLMLK